MDKASIFLRTVIYTLLLLFVGNASAQITGSRTGWIMFDDSVANALELREGQMDRLHTIDRRYQADYERLGADPRSDPNYLALTERRNAEIQTVLDASQYERWMRLNDYDYDNTRRRAEPGPQSTEMDRRDPQGNQFIDDARSPAVDPNHVPKTGGGGSGVGGADGVRGGGGLP
jgi:hypothetical protein